MSIDARTCATMVALLLAMAAPLVVGPAAAQEKLANGKLDAGASGWSVGGSAGEIGFDPTRDASGSALSGSLEIVHQTPGNAGMFVGHCVPGIQAGTAYFMGGRLRFREGQSAIGRATLLVHFRSTPDCSGSSTGVESTEEVYPEEVGRGVWIRLREGTRSSGFTAPPGSKSASFFVFVGNVEDGPELTVNADDLFFAPVGSPMCGKLPATLVGSAGPDLLIGTAASDVIVGLGGADQIDGKGGNDVICGGPGDDTLYGGFGDDVIFGNGGGDHLYGAADHDRLVGGAGPDRLFGGSGTDELVGGAGTDTCDGGSDADPSAKGCETVTGVP